MKNSGSVVDEPENAVLYAHIACRRPGIAYEQRGFAIRRPVKYAAIKGMCRLTRLKGVA